jgi:mono/diheme cytochrome c family protein
MPRHRASRPGYRSHAAVAALWLFPLSSAVCLAGLTPRQLASVPAPALVKIDFARHIQPIFEASCVQCHARGKDKGQFSLETREAFLEAGKSAESLVVELISGLNPDSVMPKKGKRLTPEQVALFRAWIDQGLAWPDTITFHKHEPANLRPRELAELTVPARFENPIDAFVDAGFTRNGFAWPQLVDDRTYARRVWLDTIGLLPPPAELAAFLADRVPDKRARLVQRLLGQPQAYAEHWLTFWNDLLRNDYKGTGYIDGGRKQITAWLYTALARNLPYDRFVAELVNPGAEAEGFTNGILWRGEVNASMVPPMQAAQGVAQVFLGVNLKCASCHDSFINEYTLKDSYGLATVYAKGPLEVAECDVPTGHLGQVKFLYEEIGRIDAKATPAMRKQQLADVITGRKNGRLPRAMVNRLWQRFLGHGLVEPVDEMDKLAWAPDLMDWLAEDLVAHRYDLKHTMARILTSRAYQLPAVNVAETGENFVFRGPGVRRMNAEVFTDALRRLAGVDYPESPAKVNRTVALAGQTPAALPLRPKWIWATANAQVTAAPATVAFARKVTLAALPTEAFFTIAADNTYEITINGKKVANSSKRSSTGTEVHDVKKHLLVGENTFGVAAINYLADGTSPVLRAEEKSNVAQPAVDRVSAARQIAEDTPAGLLLYARIRAGDEVMDFVTDSTWSARLDDGEAHAAVELGEVDLAPWKAGAHFLELAAAPPGILPVQRASLVAADPLMAALGRPNREQIVTVRQGLATTLQALELTNGHTLAALLKQVSDRLVTTAPADAGTLVASLYQQTLGRPPGTGELAAATQLVGSPLQSEGVQDLLWSLAMLPEFQLID